jgi:hypothetical protein
MLLAMPMAAAAAPQVIEVRAQLEQLDVASPARVTLREALFRPVFDEGAAAGSFAVFEDGRVTVTQWWRNNTVLIDPITGETIHRHDEPLTSRTLDLQPESIELVRPVDTPEIRIALRSVLGMRAENAAEVRIDAQRPPDALGVPRAYTTAHLATLQPFVEPPPEAGGVDFRPCTLEGYGDANFLIDGWVVRLHEGGEVEEVVTGRDPGPGHRFGQGGTRTESYSFLTIRAESTRTTFPHGSAVFQGLAPMPQLAWDGPAKLAVLRGDVNVGPVRVPVTEKQFHIDGRFQAQVLFGPQAAYNGAEFLATGVGTTSSLGNLPLGGGYGVAQAAGVWTSLAVGALTIGVLGVHTFRAPGRLRSAAAPPAAPAPAPPPAEEKLGLPELIERAQKEPLNSGLQFDLGVELIKIGRADVGLRALDRSFRLEPGGILKLLEDPELAPLRERHEVRLLLGRFQREQHRKVWAGYA